MHNLWMVLCMLLFSRDLNGQKQTCHIGHGSATV
jgi:hypothetical protein